MPAAPAARIRLSLRLTALLLASPLAGGAALSDARVDLDHGRVSIHSRSAPLTDVLARFAQATGAEVVYEAPRPRQLVTVAIDEASPAAAIARLLEGQGLNYALRLDRSGRNVELLVLSASASASAVPAAAAAGRRSPAPSPVEEPLVEDEAEGVDQLTEADATEDQESAPASSGEAFPSVAAPFAGSAPAESPTPHAAPGSASPEPAAPHAPSPVSYPAAPAFPPQPVPPGPASYPQGK